MGLLTLKLADFYSIDTQLLHQLQHDVFLSAHLWRLCQVQVLNKHRDMWVWDGTQVSPLSFSY